MEEISHRLWSGAPRLDQRHCQFLVGHGIVIPTRSQSRIQEDYQSGNLVPRGPSLKTRPEMYRSPVRKRGRSMLCCHVLGILSYSLPVPPRIHLSAPPSQDMPMFHSATVHPLEPPSRPNSSSNRASASYLSCTSQQRQLLIGLGLDLIPLDLHLRPLTAHNIQTFICKHNVSQ